MARSGFPGKTVLEFFAGIGLVQRALCRTGWRCIYANDIDAKKREMYEGHFGLSPHYHEGDIWDTETVLNRIREDPYLATASFPCTDMSLAGKMRGFGGSESSALFGFLRVLKALGQRQPKLVMLENVRGFLNSHGGKDFADAATALADLGYWLDSFIIDARWFVPQSRQRLFVIGYHESIVNARPIFRSKQHSLFDEWKDVISRHEQLRPSRLREILNGLKVKTGWATIDSGLPQQKAYSLSDVIELHGELDWWSRTEVRRHLEMMSDRHRQMLMFLKTQDGCHVLTAFRRVRHGQLRMEVRYDGVAGCLRTPRGGSAKQIVLVVENRNVRMRWMTPREYAHLQGVPDFTLPQNTIQGLFGFGDAVCVPVIEWIDESMLTPVYDAACCPKVPARRRADRISHARPVLAR